MDNSEATIAGIIAFFLSIIFLAASVAWFVIPIYNPAVAAANSYWTISGLTPGASYIGAFSVVNTAIADAPLIGLIFSSIALMVIALRGKFSLV